MRPHVLCCNQDPQKARNGARPPPTRATFTPRYASSSPTTQEPAHASPHRTHLRHPPPPRYHRTDLSHPARTPPASRPKYLPHVAACSLLPLSSQGRGPGGGVYPRANSPRHSVACLLDRFRLAVSSPSAITPAIQSPGWPTPSTSPWPRTHPDSLWHSVACLVSRIAPSLRLPPVMSPEMQFHGPPQPLNSSARCSAACCGMLASRRSPSRRGQDESGSPPLAGEGLGERFSCGILWHARSIAPPCRIVPVGDEPRDSIAGRTPPLACPYPLKTAPTGVLAAPQSTRFVPCVAAGILRARVFQSSSHPSPPWADFAARGPSSRGFNPQASPPLPSLPAPGKGFWLPLPPREGGWGVRSAVRSER